MNQRNVPASVKFNHHRNRAFKPADSAVMVHISNGFQPLTYKAVTIDPAIQAKLSHLDYVGGSLAAWNQLAAVAAQYGWVEMVRNGSGVWVEVVKEGE
jgi:hypothetical protein